MLFASFRTYIAVRFLLHFLRHSLIFVMIMIIIFVMFKIHTREIVAAPMFYLVLIWLSP